MQLENIGKTIQKISFSKKHVTLYFSNRKMVISKEAYVNSYLFVGKTLTKKEISDLKKMTDLDKGLEYALSLLKKSIYTEWRIREKLYAKEFDKKSVDAIIKFLKQHDLINDEMFILNYIEEGKDKGYGKNKIINKLMEKGIFAEKLNKIKFPDSIELIKAKSHIPSLEKKYSKLNYESKKNHIHDYLIRQGFDSHIALECLKLINKINPIDEKNKLINDYHKLIKKIERKEFPDRYKRKEYIITKLLAKGYKYNEIIRIMEEN